ncbi:hypothetical protein EV192_10896 [Actinocrispum wychmicini]|uniref:Uncharacterized protein n=2 Tax=Actinocrispum wychmicini TaxID=1213861 RepID=A0A4R2JDE4_9PSEU|nr:hypothetical protein EV192_10896 [Actinocrispum wychmicini]
MVDEEHLRSALRKQFDMPKDSLRVEIGPPVPGMLVFYAYDLKDSRVGVTGVFDGEVRTDFDVTLPLVLRALGYGEREVDPMVVAGAVGKLEGNPGTPFLTQFAIDQSGNPAVMTLPRLVSVEGQQVVEYWNKTSRTPPWRSRVFRKADGSFEVRHDNPAR